MTGIRTEIKMPGAREPERAVRDDPPHGREEGGRTRIADGVVAKIAGMAAREIGGVHSMGGGAARAAVNRAGEHGSVSRGVSVEVGERQAAVDIDLVVEYGAGIQDLAAAVRRNVTAAVERMTGLEVTEINIKVDDIHLPGDGRGDECESASRVR